MFDRKFDTWLTAAELEAMACDVPEESWHYPQAIRLQLEFGRDSADTRARDLLQRTEGLHEVSKDLIVLAWHYRNDFPPLARQNFAPQLHDDVPHAEARAKIGDPIAQRYVAAQNVGRVGGDDSTWMEVVPMTSRVKSRRECMIDWAKREWRWSLAGFEQFEVAIREGWTEVADALDANPHLINSLLTWEVRGMDGFDAPGFLLAEKLLLGWSRLCPTPLLAKLILTARKMDLVAEARAAEMAAARRIPNINRKDAVMAIDVMASWWEQMQPSMAIAWTRWRNYHKAGLVKS